MSPQRNAIGAASGDGPDLAHLEEDEVEHDAGTWTPAVFADVHTLGDLQHLARATGRPFEDACDAAAEWAPRPDPALVRLLLRDPHRWALLASRDDWPAPVLEQCVRAWMRALPRTRRSQANAGELATAALQRLAGRDVLQRDHWAIASCLTRATRRRHPIVSRNWDRWRAFAVASTVGNLTEADLRALVDTTDPSFARERERRERLIRYSGITPAALASLVTSATTRDTLETLAYNRAVRRDAVLGERLRTLVAQHAPAGLRAFAMDESGDRLRETVRLAIASDPAVALRLLAEVGSLADGLLEPDELLPLLAAPGDPAHKLELLARVRRAEAPSARVTEPATEPATELATEPATEPAARSPRRPARPASVRRGA